MADNTSQLYKHKIVIITAPSGAGKSTIVQAIMPSLPQLQFSISATTRAPRPGEVHGQHYYFTSVQQFTQQVSEQAFIEWEKVYEGKYYGTLKLELERIWSINKLPILDIDVKGAVNVQQQIEYEVCSIFIQPPSLQELATRLANRGTETPASLQERIAKAEWELTQAPLFKHSVVNKDLQLAIQQVKEIITHFLRKP
jgi:guanylate kinase